MILSSREDNVKLLKELDNMLGGVELNQIWPDFKKMAIALYNSEEVFLIGHPNPPKEFELYKGIYIGPWSSSFVGNTTILLNQVQTAIWDIKYITPFTTIEKLCSQMAHELFHSYQFQCFEELDRRFPDDIMFLSYPLLSKNILLRKLEREKLLQACFEEDLQGKMEYIIEFVSYREERKKLIGENLSFELGLESLEGTATYIEYSVLSKLSNYPNAFLLSKFCSGLDEYTEDLNNFRYSCYGSGMVLCLLLDKLCSGWKLEFSETSLQLYDFLKEKLQLAPIDVEGRVDSIADLVVEGEKKRRFKVLEDFDNLEGYKIVIKGQMGIKGYDPMNFTPIDNSLVHKSFLKVATSKQELFIAQKVHSIHSKDNPYILEEIEFYSSSKPIVNEDHIWIVGIGEVYGILKVEDRKYVLNIK